MRLVGIELDDLGAAIPAGLEPNDPGLIRKAMVHLPTCTNSSGQAAGTQRRARSLTAASP